MVVGVVGSSGGQTGLPDMDTGDGTESGDTCQEAVGAGRAGPELVKEWYPVGAQETGGSEQPRLWDQPGCRPTSSHAGRRHTLASPDLHLSPYAVPGGVGPGAG